MKRLIIVAAAVCLLAACNDMPHQKAAPPKEPEVVEVVPPVAPATDAWLGDWVGVEGNTLKIEAGAAPGEYAIAEQTLDGPLTYAAKAEGDVIAFQEKETAKTIRAGTGDETGLKYLAGKTNCLVIESGRGFCRE